MDTYQYFLKFVSCLDMTNIVCLRNNSSIPTNTYNSKTKCR